MSGQNLMVADQVQAQRLPKPWPFIHICVSSYKGGKGLIGLTGNNGSTGKGSDLMALYGCRWGQEKPVEVNLHIIFIIKWNIPDTFFSNWSCLSFEGPP